MSVTNDLLDGLAQMLAAAGVGVYHPDGSGYAANETGILFKLLPPSPDRVIVLTAFGANSDQPRITLGNQPVQLRFRGGPDPRDVDLIGDAAFTVLHGAEDLWFGSVHVIQILRTNSIPLGQDEQDSRWQRGDNYSLDVDYPTSANRPI